jgi:lipopolysaccharide/colanic/teichoic acid biosynthesis glycosyltransferase
MPNIATTFMIADCGTEAGIASWNRRLFDVSKRLMDITFGLSALIFLSPVILLCSVIVKFSSGSPVIYKQVRVGKDGKLFNMYKLRTMYADAERTSGPVWASADDPRVIPACRWMRRGHFDELPQLINVLKGEMSLVGPRPERPEIMEKLQEVYPGFYHRLAVKPGITGLAQIRNGYDVTIEGIRSKLEADLEYIIMRSWVMEIWILAMTLPKFYDRSAH